MTVLTRVSNPFVGPRPVERNEPLYGRTADADRLVDLLIAERVVLLYSPSGAGKTSLLQAAVIPRLEPAGFTVLPTIHLNRELSDNRPRESGGQPASNRYVVSTLLSLEEGLLAEQRTVPTRLSQPEFGEYLAQRLGGERTPRHVLIFDQFEQLLTLDPTDQDTKYEYVEWLADALEDRRCWVIFAIREDLLAGLDPYRALLPTELSTTFRLDLLTRDQARGAILITAGQHFTPDAAEVIVDTLSRVQVTAADGRSVARRGPYVEPVQLQVACRWLWQRCVDVGIRVSSEQVKSLNIERALAGYYSDQVTTAARHDINRERHIRESFETLLIAGYVRGGVPRSRMLAGGIDEEAIEVLVGAHLIRQQTHQLEPWYELAHDSLVGPVRDSNADWREIHLTLLQRQARLWFKGFQSPDLLLRGKTLAAEERLLFASSIELTDEELAFLKASQQERRKGRVIRGLLLVCLVLFIAALIGLTLAILFGEEAALRAQLATSLELSASAVSNLDTNAERSIWLGRQALGMSMIEGPFASPLREAEVSAGLTARDALYQAIDRSRIRLTLVHGERGEAVDGLAFNRDGSRLATAGRDSIVRVWDPVSGRQLTQLSLPDKRITGVAFNPDGDRLAAVGEDGNVKLWHLADNELGYVPDDVISTGFGALTGVTFSPDGQRLAAAGEDFTVRLWDVGALGNTPLELRHSAAVGGPTFSPDGTLIAAGSRDKTAIIWKTTHDGCVLVTLEGHLDQVSGVAFGPQGKRLATASMDDTVRVWDTSGIDADGPCPTSPTPSPPVLLTLRGHTDAVYAVAFSGDGSKLATASADGTARVWSASTGELLLTLTGNTQPVSSVAFSPDGIHLATSSWDGTVRLWDIQGHTARVDGVAFSPDGSLLASASWDTTVQVRDLNSDRIRQMLRGHTDAVYAVAFSPDGTRVATASADWTARVWDIASGAMLTVLGPHPGEAHSDRVVDVQFSPDGAYIATASWDNSARVWDASTGELKLFLEHTQQVTAVAFNADGSQLATASLDALTRVWDPHAGKPSSTPLFTLGAELASTSSDTVTAIAFNQTGTRLASARQNGTIDVWDLGSRQVLRRLTGHAGRVSSVAFSPDGGRLLTTSQDRTARIWDVLSGQPVLTVTHAAAVNRAAWSPDGRVIAVSSASNVFVDPLDPVHLLALTDRRLTRPPTRDECRIYLHQEDCSTPARAP